MRKKILAPLNSLLQGIPAGSNANLSWNEEASTAFEDIKVALSNATLLNYPQHDSLTALFVDASDKFCGAVLSQIDNSGSHRPLEYFSAAFSDAQKRYSTFDKELLAAYLAVHLFTYFLEQCSSNCGSRPQMGSPEYFVGSLYYWNSALEIPELKCVENILILGWK